MFIDICLPKNNEQNFIEIAKKININGLCFIDAEKKKYDFNVIYGSHKKGKLVFEPLKKNIGNQKRAYYYVPNQSKSFHYPSKITQVTMKKIKESSSIILISIKEINQDNIEEIKFLIKLAKKYGVCISFASFAESPYELISPTQIDSLSKILGMDTSQAKRSVSCLEDFHSAIFL